jgi:TolB-like protein
MKNRNSKILSLGFFLALLMGCKAAPIYNVNQTEIPVPGSSSLQQVERAILKGSKMAGWRAKRIGRGRISATYMAKRGMIAAMVDITYDRSAYSITYRNSRNLKYTERSNSQRKSGNFFSEYNPFGADQDQALGPPPATIHKVYNKWVEVLEKEINISLRSIINASPHQTTRHRQQTIASSCTDTPHEQLSGQAKIIKSRVNLRSGASAQCSVVGGITRGETFSLRGKKNNWYYISRSQGDTGWVYAPLVQTLSEKIKPATATVTTAAIPQSPPRKKISIAVIEFKTLNQEAQQISLGNLVSETFTSSLVNSSAFRIIERNQLDKVIKEMEMNQTGFIETTDAVEIGKMLHADAIITGSVALLAGQIQLNARIIDIESAYVISAETKTTQYTLEKINVLVDDIVSTLSAKF